MAERIDRSEEALKDQPAESNDPSVPRLTPPPVWSPKCAGQAFHPPRAYAIHLQTPSISAVLSRRHTPRRGHGDPKRGRPALRRLQEVRGPGLQKVDVYEA